MTYIKSYKPYAKEKKLEEYVFSCPSSLSLSFAVQLIDHYTQKEPLGEIRVRLKEGNIIPIKNLSGYYTFSRLSEGKYTLSVESEIYFSKEVSVSIPFINSVEPVKKVTLRPRPLYPFPERATLLRGMLIAEPDILARIIIVKVVLKTTNRKIWGIPDEKGEFVLYFWNTIKEKAHFDLVIRGKGIKQPVPASVEEGKSTYIRIISISNNA